MSASGSLIGIGRDLTVSPLPHHRTYGSRIRRFGRFRQGDRNTPTGASAPGVPATSSSQRPSITRPLAGCHLAAPPQTTTPLYRSGLPTSMRGVGSEEARPERRWPPSAAQTARAVFPHAAFTKIRLPWRQATVSVKSRSQGPAPRTAWLRVAPSTRHSASASTDGTRSVG